jgi:hypothetical protein
MTFPTISPAEAVDQVDRLLRAGRITPIARTYLVLRIKQIMRDGDTGHRLYRLVESYR